MDIEKLMSRVTGSNRSSNEPEVIRGQSNRSPSSSPVMGGSWEQGENPKKKMVHEGKDETSDKFEIMDEVSKLGIAKEDEQEYI